MINFKASVIIPNWNGKHLLKACLDSLIKQTVKNFEVIVVDNGSTDGSAGYLRKFYPQDKIIELDKNIGFAPAVNLGIKQALGEYIVLLNNDTKVDKNCLKYLLQSADKIKAAGFVAAKMLQFYNPELIDSAGDYINAAGHGSNIGRGERDSEKFNQGKFVFSATGGGCLIKRSVFKKVGLFDDDYFAYFEDMDLCFRAQLKGFKVYFEPRAIIYHIHKATSNKNRPFTEYLQFRNMTMTVIKNFPKTLLLHDFNWLKIVLVNLNTIRYLATKGMFWQAIRADWYILTHILKILKKRRAVQSAKSVPDSYILSWVRPKKVTIFGMLKSGF